MMDNLDKLVGGYPKEFIEAYEKIRGKPQRLGDVTITHAEWLEYQQLKKEKEDERN